MTTVSDAVAATARRLREAGIEPAERDARRLVAFVADIPADRLTLSLRDDFPNEEALETVVMARLARQPVSQITGARLFYGRSFRVTCDVLDPRPETEELVAAALEEPFGTVLDMGSGTGCILLTLLAERPGVSGLGVDISEPALEIARENAQRLGVSVAFRQSDWFSAVDGTFDLIVSNPPYIADVEMADLGPETRIWEPRIALTDGADGLRAYREIARHAPRFLDPGGRLLVEIGPTQAGPVSDLLALAGLVDIEVRRDMDGRDRVVLARSRTG